MIEAYRIAANLTITGDAVAKMTKFANSTEKANKHITQLLKLMKPLNVEFGALERTLGPLSSGFAAFSSSLASTNTRLTRLSTRAATARTELNMLAFAANRAGGLLPSGGGGSAGGGAGGGRGRRGGGIGGGTFMAGLAGRFGLAGSVPLLAGIGAGAMFHSGFEQNQDIGRNTFQLRALGLSPAQISDILNSTNGGIPGVSSAHQLEAFKDAMMATQSFSRAKFLAPSLGKARFVAGGFGGISEGQLQNLVRFAEMRGGSDESAVAAQLALGMQMMALSGGSIKPTGLRTFMRRGTGAGSLLSDLGLLRMEPILQELGESQTGTALSTLRGFLVGGIGMTRNRALDLQKFGVMGPVELDKDGRPIGSKFGTFPASSRDIVNRDPFEFLKNILLPAYKKKGITSLNDVSDRITYDFPRTPANMFILMLKNLEKIVRESGNIKNLESLDQLVTDFGKTQPGAVMRLGEAWRSFTKAITPELVSSLNGISYILEHLSKVINHPDKQRFGIEDRGIIGKASDWLSSSSSSSKTTAVHTSIHLDGVKFGNAVSAGITRANNNFVDGGQSGLNIPHLAPSPTVNYFGGGIS